MKKPWEFHLLQALRFEDEDQKDWNVIALTSLKSAYGTEEPDYAGTEVIERNPVYGRGYEQKKMNPNRG